MKEKGILMNSIWFREKSNLSQSDIKKNILKAVTETEVLFNLIELFKIGDFFLNFEEQIGEEASADEKGDFYFRYCAENDTESYYFQQNLAFPGDFAKKLIQRVMIAANNEEPLRMALIPSLLSIFTGEKVPGDYYTIINESNYKDFIDYINGLSHIDWEKGQKYFYGYKV
ncbi:hypothetical protein HPT25_26970 [Bacillus sp. BRMEA1]|uniref:Imm47 family immunity protein n=1 Tax=Neobacillus endophyticus TaxID=2738405 RepID=UPI0015665183|nr:Imm47 family immunity protein [Neobacillus endophyticus]NRD80970.1 hypothetical protein [Neobacillus endophyticus]